METHDRESMEEQIVRIRTTMRKKDYRCQMPMVASPFASRTRKESGYEKILVLA